MIRGRSSPSLLAAPLGALAIAVGLSACGGSHHRVASTTPTVSAHHTRTHTNRTTTSTSTSTASSLTTSTGAAEGTATSGPSTTPGAGGGSGGGSGGSGSGGASLRTSTTTTRTTTTTSSSCHGQDCQGGSPTVPGSVAPVNGRCHSGYVYVAAQDGGPALCVPVTPPATTSTTTP